MRSPLIQLVLSIALAAASATDAGAQIVRKILIIGVDGMRPDAMLAANTPTIAGLIAGGAFRSQCAGEDSTVGCRCWSSITADADFNDDEGVDGDDVIAFFARWDAGC